MPREVFYSVDEGGGSPVQQCLESLDRKQLARSLARIDLLEADGPLPDAMDAALKRPSRPSCAPAPLADASVAPCRVLSAGGRARLQFIYSGQDATVTLVDVRTRRVPKDGKRAERKPALARAAALAAKVDSDGAPKSHRAYVAERTLADPTLAALYGREREKAQFALSFSRLCETAGLTTEALAERTGMNETRIRSIERGRLPKLAQMRRLVDVLQARVVILPGSGIAIEPFTAPEPARRLARPRRAAPGPLETVSEA